MISEQEKTRLLKQYDKRHKGVLEERHGDDLHTEMQYHLLKIGKALGYDPVVANNDRSKSETKNTIQLIDVIRFEKNSNRTVCAFEVEKSTSIYSAILRLSDLAFSLSDIRVHCLSSFPTAARRM